ncbi:MAG: hypothetical protein ACXWVP_11490 [Burkholderiales bacterium]
MAPTEVGADSARNRVHLVQLLLPLYDNAGRRVPQQHFAEVREELTQRFGGVTAYLRSPAQGTWKDESGAVDRDEVVMCEVMVELLDRQWWSSYRSGLEARFGQRELVVRAFPLERL